MELSSSIKSSESSEIPIVRVATHGTTADDLNEAIKLACEEAAQLLVEQWGFTWEDAFIFLSFTDLYR